MSIGFFSATCTTGCQPLILRHVHRLAAYATSSVRIRKHLSKACFEATDVHPKIKGSEYSKLAALISVIAYAQLILGCVVKRSGLDRELLVVVDAIAVHVNFDD